MASANKKSKASDPAENDAAVEAAFLDLQKLETEFDALTDRLMEEEKALQLKYDKLRKPLYAQRRKLVKQIPKFWSTVVRCKVKMWN